VLCSQGKAPFAFAGLNPRISDSNRRELFDIITPDREAFIALAENRAPDGEPYVRETGGERHYHSHARILLEAIRGTEFEGQRFEDLAVCTELFMCATPPRGTTALRAALRDGSAVCPVLHFWKAIQRAAPKLVVTLGDDVFDYVSTFATRDESVYRLNTPTAPVIIAISHPANRRLPPVELQRVASACREILLDKVPTAWDFRTSLSSSPSGEGNERERRFDWLHNRGWQVSHQPADYTWLKVDPQRLITYLLYKNGGLRYKMSLNGAQLRQAIKWPRWPAELYVNPVTKRKHGSYTDEFLPQWAQYVSKVG
jgi:hypothetical protein